MPSMWSLQGCPQTRSTEPNIKCLLNPAGIRTAPTSSLPVHFIYFVQGTRYKMWFHDLFKHSSKSVATSSEVCLRNVLMVFMISTLNIDTSLTALRDWFLQRSRDVSCEVRTESWYIRPLKVIAFNANDICWRYELSKQMLCSRRHISYPMRGS
jgi:hypothetical protein